MVSEVGGGISSSPIITSNGLQEGQQSNDICSSGTVQCDEIDNSSLNGQKMEIINVEGEPDTPSLEMQNQSNIAKKDWSNLSTSERIEKLEKEIKKLKGEDDEENKSFMQKLAEALNQAARVFKETQAACR